MRKTDATSTGTTRATSRVTSGVRAGFLALCLGLSSAAATTATAPAPAEAQASTSCPEMTDSIDRLYSAYFLRAPEGGGFEFWSTEYAAGRWNLERMSDFFATSDEFNTRYSTLTNAQFIDLVYRNVLNRAPESDGFNFWLGQLDSGALTRGGMMIRFSESKEYTIITGTEPPMAGYFSWYPAGTTWTCANGSFAAPADHANVDVFGVNRGGSAQNWQAWLVDTAGTRQENLLSRNLPAQSFAFFWSANLVNPAPPTPIGGVEIVADASVTTIVVRTPQPLAVERADWSSIGG